MSEKNGEFPTYEGIIRRKTAAEGRIHYIDQQINSLKGISNFFKRRDLKKKRLEDLEYIKKLMDKTPTSSVNAATKEANQTLSSAFPHKDRNG